MHILDSDIAILFLSTIGLAVTTVSIVLDTREQKQRVTTENVRAEV